jgi:hypothetical protein
MNFLRTLVWLVGLCLLLSPQLEPVAPAYAWHHGSIAAVSPACPFGNSGIDGCGVSPGLFFAPAINTTTQPTASQWSSFARQSSQVWSGNGCSPDPNHCQTFNLTGVDFGVGPNASLASLTPISSWVAGTHGCTYYPIGALLPSAVRTQGWPHDASNNALINVLACTGNGSSSGNPGNPYTISGWSFTDANNGQCAAIYDIDTTHYTQGTGTVTVTGNSFINSTQCIGSCNQSSSAQSIVYTSPNYTLPTCSQGATGVVLGFVTIAQGVYTPFVVNNNYYDFLWDQTCCSLQTLAGGAVTSNGLRGDFTFELNYIRHATHNPLGVSWLAGGEGACTASPTNTPSLGASWPFPGYNVNIKFNYLEGIGFYTGYGHGEFMNWGVSVSNTVTTDAGATLSGTTLSTASASLTIGSAIYDSAGVINGGVIVTAGSGTTYTVTNPNSISFSGSAIKAMYGAICQVQYSYNTIVIPKVSSAGGMTTAMYGFNSTITYGAPGGQLEYWSSQNNTVVSNNVGGATNASVSLNIKLTGASDATCAAITPYSNGNCLVVLGYGSSTSGGTCPGDAAYISNQGPFIGDYGAQSMGFNGFAYCNSSDQGVYWMGCGSPQGTACPILDWDVAAGTSNVTGGSLSGTTVTLDMPWTWKTATSVAITGLNPSDWETGSPFTITTTVKGNSIAYTNASATSPSYVSGGVATSTSSINSGNPLANQTFSHGIVSAPLMEISHVGAHAIDVKGNFTDETGKAGGTAIAIGGAAVYCFSSASITNNLNLVSGGATSSDNTGSGC